MKPRSLAGLVMLGAAVALGGLGIVAVAVLGVPNLADADYDGAAVAAKGPLLPIVRPAANTEEALAVADAAIVDASLLSPYPMSPASVASVPAPQAAAAEQPVADPVRSFADDAIGTIRSSPAIAAVKTVIAAPRIDKESGLTLAHITQIKAMLNLTRDQERLWPPVEAELREIARQFVAQKSGGKKIVLDASEAQRLYWAAGPLIMSMTADQKEEVRRLARAMGLAEVASLI